MTAWSRLWPSNQCQGKKCSWNIHIFSCFPLKCWLFFSSFLCHFKALFISPFHTWTCYSNTTSLQLLPVITNHARGSAVYFHSFGAILSVRLFIKSTILFFASTLLKFNAVTFKQRNKYLKAWSLFTFQHFLPPTPLSPPPTPPHPPSAVIEIWTKQHGSQ